MITIAIYHCSIKIISRSSGRSVIASAAYRSGSTLYDSETGLTHDYTRKGGVILSEIMLPETAPPEYADRQTLWTEVQKQESRSDAALAREIEVALPKEMTRGQQIECVRRYVQDNFVDSGMIADWALHDKGDGNPHAHILLSVRGFDEKGKWEKKTRSVFANAVDESGKAIYDPALPSYDPRETKDGTGHRPSEKYRIPQLAADGTQKTRSRKGKGEELLWHRVNIPVHDWDSHLKAEEWREAWARTCNFYLDEENKVDHRSFARQGITDREPTIHEGISARQIEQRGDISDRCEINRDIREKNRVIANLKQTIQKIKTSAIAQLELLRTKLQTAVSNLASVKRQEDAILKSGQLLQEQVSAYETERSRINQKIVKSLAKISSMQSDRKNSSSKKSKKEKKRLKDRSMVNWKGSKLKEGICKLFLKDSVLPQLQSIRREKLKRMHTRRNSQKSKLRSKNSRQKFLHSNLA